MSMRLKMARAGYEAATREFVADLRRSNPFGKDHETHRWENQPAVLQECWLANVDAMLDELINPTEEMEAYLRDRPFENGRELYRGAIAAVKDGK